MFTYSPTRLEDDEGDRCVVITVRFAELSVQCYGEQ